jgi:dihydrofolate reductase
MDHQVLESKVVGCGTGLVGTLAKPYDLLLGRKTYDIFTAYWRYVPADNPIGPVFTKANKYVLTRRPAKLAWANSHKLRNLDELKKVKAEEPRKVRILSSGEAQRSIRNCSRPILSTVFCC